MTPTVPSFVYFGGEPLGVPVLTQLEKGGMLPSLVVCNPDRPVGRKQLLTPPPVKVWAEERGVEVWQPESFADQEAITQKLQKYDLFVVVAYNKILPSWLIELPKHKTLNVHPSLLPLLRGASPIRSTILEDMRETCGVSVMQLDEKMDHGPILTQEIVEIPEDNWPIHGTKLDTLLAQKGGALLAETLPLWVAGEIEPQTQDHDAATYCGRLERSMGELTIDPRNLPTGDTAHQTLLKIRAFDGFPGTFFMHEGKRIKVLDATVENDALVITQVLPEGKNKLSFAQYLSTLQ